MVEVFKTNVKNRKTAEIVLRTLRTHLPVLNFNFDLDDCDRILRVQSDKTPVECRKIIQLVETHAVEISLLEE